MVQYIYFVKCPCCEDEHFDMFDDAKNYALGCLSKKPIITQTEVCRNDFGECTDSSDLGQVWSWEDMMKDMPKENTMTTFSKSETIDYDDDYFNCEFDNLDSVPDNYVQPTEIKDTVDEPRKPIPADMSIESLVEEMEENEDMVECKVCEELFEKASCTKDPKRGWVCENCNSTSLVEGVPDAKEPITESANSSKYIELYYDMLTVPIVTKYIPATYQEPSDYEEGEWSDDFCYKVDFNTVAETLWNDEIITEEDVADVPGGFDALYEDSALMDKFFAENMDKLVDKYYDKLLATFREDAEEAAKEEFQRRYDSNVEYGGYDESLKVESETGDKLMLEEFDSDLTACPECGEEEAFDHSAGFCTCCGFTSLKEDYKEREAAIARGDYFELEYDDLPLTASFTDYGPQTMMGEPDSGVRDWEEEVEVSYTYKVPSKEIVKALIAIAPELADDPRCVAGSDTFDWDYVDGLINGGKYSDQIHDYFQDDAEDQLSEDYAAGDSHIEDQVERYLQDLEDRHLDGDF